MQLSIIVGDDRDRAGRAVAAWLADRVCARYGLEADLLDLGAACLPDAVSGLTPGALPRPPAVLDLAPWLAAADGFVVVVPVRVPRSLRSAVAWHAAEWRAKPVAFTLYGAPPGTSGQHPVVPELRSIFAAVHAVTVGQVVHHEDADDSRYDDTDRLLDRLTSRAGALRAVRSMSPDPLLNRKN
ncbi:NADPH-dependent oxidoreductase [Nonomuraea sp. NN258]|uniref:NAD(P)H-dependent oxidoreductase n=1 Tax=Nonomuraea antri TaxID=2730852 RepID=UPI0015695130|nr:NAD(P)H-dependent oxidoreductase [Nonomuraea antri]NRQ35833.1 NADPH-dependent oxidoreductase [Nonomuraea antri]